MDQYLRHHQPQPQPGNATNQAEACAFRRQHRHDLPPRDADMAEHAEFAGPGKGLRRKAGGDADQPDDDGDRLQRIGHGKALVENRQRHGPHLARFGEQSLRRQARRQLLA